MKVRINVSRKKKRFPRREKREAYDANVEDVGTIEAIIFICCYETKTSKSKFIARYDESIIDVIF